MKYLKVELSGCYLEFKIGVVSWLPGGALGSIVSLFVFLGFSAAPLHLTDVFSLLGGLPLSLLKPVCISLCSLLPLPFFFPLLLPFLPTLEVLICPPHLPWLIAQPVLVRGTPGLQCHHLSSLCCCFFLSLILLYGSS